MLAIISKVNKTIQSTKMMSKYLSASLSNSAKLKSEANRATTVKFRRLN